MPTKRREVVVRAQSTGIHPWETTLLSAGQFQVELCVCVCVCVCVCECMLSRVQLFVTPWTVAQGFPGKNTGVGCHLLLQAIFPTQGSDPCLLH